MIPLTSQQKCQAIDKLFSESIDFLEKASEIRHHYLAIMQDEISTLQQLIEDKKVLDHVLKGYSIFKKAMSMPNIGEDDYSSFAVQYDIIVALHIQTVKQYYDAILIRETCMKI